MNTIINIIYKLISLLDKIDYKYIHNKLLDGYKTINDIDISDSNIEILTDTGFKPITNIMMSKPFEQYTIILENGSTLIGADRHIVFDENYNEIFIKNLHIGDYIITNKGKKQIISIIYNRLPVSMCDLTVNDENHRFYSNGILSHNSVTTAIYCLWKILFHTDKNGLILSKSGPAGQDLLSKIKDMYMYLPYHLKIGTMKWNQSEISFDNNSKIATEAFGPTAGLGKTINFLILDEFAWCPPNDVELFYNNIIPTVTTISNSNVCIMSTQNGFNLFYKLWKAAIEKRSSYAPYKIDWWQVPQWNDETKKWDKRTEAWHKEMVGILGSEEAFQYQYGTQFSASDKCLVSRECLAEIRDTSVLYVNHDELPIFLQYKNYLFWDPGFDLENLKTGWFIILCDLAEGGGGDYTVFTILQVIDKDKFKQVGYWRSNEVELKIAALEFWLLVGQLFTNDRCIFSVEWNTYGALFYSFLLNYNEADAMPEFSWRLNVCQEIDIAQFVQYKKTDDDVPGQLNKNRKTIPGLRMSAGNKGTSCVLLKMEIESKNVFIYDIITVGELENFEDKNGNGTYKASYGHDDMIMTFVQIPMLKKTAKYKDFMEEYTLSSITSEVHTDFYNPYENMYSSNGLFQELPTFNSSNNINTGYKSYNNLFNV